MTLSEVRPWWGVLRYTLSAVLLLALLAMGAMSLSGLFDAFTDRASTGLSLESASPAPPDPRPLPPPSTASLGTPAPSASASASPVTAVPAPAERPSAQLIRELARLQGRLRAAPREDDFNLRMPVMLPLATRAALRAFKDAALAAIEAIILEADNPDHLDDDTIERALAAGGVNSASEDRAYQGGQLYVSFRPAPGHVDRWVVTLSLSAECGVDTIVAVFERRPLGELAPPRLALVVRADDFVAVSGFRSGLDWKISPPDARDRYYLLVAFTNPWCGSSWRSFEYLAVEPSGDPWRPKVLVDHAQPFHFQWDGFRLDAGATRFDVGFSALPQNGAPGPTPITHAWTREGGPWRTSPSTTQTEVRR